MNKKSLLINLILVAVIIPVIYLIFSPRREKDNPSSETPLTSNSETKKEKVKEKKVSSETRPEPQKTTVDTVLPEEKNEKQAKVDNPSEKTSIPDLEDKPEPLRTLLDPRKDDTKRNEAVNFLRDSGYKNLTNDLITVLDNPNEKARFRSFAVQHLYNNYASAGDKERQKIREMLYKSLKDRHVKVRREALLTLVRIGDPRGKETAVKWLTDKNKDNVRDLAIRCVKLLDLKQYIPTIRQYLNDKNEVIRIAAIVALSQWQDEKSKPAFQKAAESSSVRLQRAGKAALIRLEKETQ